MLSSKPTGRLADLSHLALGLAVFTMLGCSHDAQELGDFFSPDPSEMPTEPAAESGDASVMPQASQDAGIAPAAHCDAATDCGEGENCIDRTCSAAVIGCDDDAQCAEGACVAASSTVFGADGYANGTDVSYAECSDGTEDTLCRYAADCGSELVCTPSYRVIDDATGDYVMAGTCMVCEGDCLGADPVGPAPFTDATQASEKLSGFVVDLHELLLNPLRQPFAQDIPCPSGGEIALSAETIVPRELTFSGCWFGDFGLWGLGEINALSDVDAVNHTYDATLRQRALGPDDEEVEESFELNGIGGTMGYGDCTHFSGTILTQEGRVSVTAGDCND